MSKEQKEALAAKASDAALWAEIDAVEARLEEAIEAEIQHHVAAYAEDLDILTAEATKRGMIEAA